MIASRSPIPSSGPPIRRSSAGAGASATSSAPARQPKATLHNAAPPLRCAHLRAAAGRCAPPPRAPDRAERRRRPPAARAGPRECDQREAAYEHRHSPGPGDPRRGDEHEHRFSAGTSSSALSGSSTHTTTAMAPSTSSTASAAASPRGRTGRPRVRISAGHPSQARPARAPSRAPPPGAGVEGHRRRGDRGHRGGDRADAPSRIAKRAHARNGSAHASVHSTQRPTIVRRRAAPAARRARPSRPEWGHQQGRHQQAQCPLGDRLALDPKPRFRRRLDLVSRPHSIWVRRRARTTAESTAARGLPYVPRSPVTRRGAAFAGTPTSTAGARGHRARPVRRRGARSEVRELSDRARGARVDPRLPFDRVPTVLCRIAGAEPADGVGHHQRRARLRPREVAEHECARRLPASRTHPLLPQGHARRSRRRRRRPRSRRWWRRARLCAGSHARRTPARARAARRSRTARAAGAATRRIAVGEDHERASPVMPGRCAITV